MRSNSAKLRAQNRITCCAVCRLYLDSAKDLRDAPVGVAEGNRTDRQGC